jgi:hypothetical protein
MARKTPSSATGTSASRRTSTPARPRRPSASCSTPASRTRSARCTTARPRWTGWSRSRSAASRSRRPPPPASGRGWTCPSRAPHQHHRHPGHVDFTIEVERSMRVLDGACMVYCAWAACSRSPRRCGARMNKYGVPRLAFVNKMDRAGAELLQGRRPDEGAPARPTRCRSSCRSAPRRTSRASSTSSSMKAIYWDEASQGMKFEYKRHPGGPQGRQANEWREKMIEAPPRPTKS